MNLQQASRAALIKRIGGWVIFILALISTLVSLCRYLSLHTIKQPGIDAVLLDFIHVMVDMVKFNTPFLNFFWQHSPLPNFQHETNFIFWIIYILVFVGLALQSSGARISRQVHFIKESLEDQAILEQLKGSDQKTAAQLAQEVNLPRHSFLRQYFALYLLPVIVAFIGYLILRLMGFVN